MAEVASDPTETNDSLDRSSEKIAPLLSALGIVTVINIDDKWVDQEASLADVQTAIVMSEVYSGEALRQIAADDPDNALELDPQNQSAVSDRLKEVWSELPSELKVRLSTDALGYLSSDGASGSEPPSETGSESRLDSLFGSDVDFRGLGMKQWAHESAAVLRSEEPVLIFVDRDFSSESGGSATTGETLLAEIVGAQNPQVYVALLSHTAVDETAEQDLRRQLETSLDVAGGTILVIGKFRLKDGAKMPGAIRDLLVLGVGEKLRELARQAIDVAKDRALEVIDDMLPYTLVGAVASAQVEGVYELDHPLRLVERSQRQAMLEAVRADGAGRHLEALRTNELVKTYLSSAEAGPQLLNALHEAAFEPVEMVNRLGLPVEIGDIFQLESVYPVKSKQQRAVPRYYILLAQVCDISMRRRGAREPHVGTFFLHEFRKLEVGADGRARGVHARLQPVGPLHPAEKPVWGVNFGSRIPVPSDAIDAVVFNREGKATIEPGVAEDRPMAHSWEQRGVKLKASGAKMLDEFRTASKTLEDVQDAETLIRRLGASFAGASMDPKSGVTAEIDLDSNQVRFGLQRVARLSPKVAAGVAALATSYDGRPGFDAAVAVEEIPTAR